MVHFQRLTLILKYYVVKQIFKDNNVKFTIISTNFYINNGTFLEKISLHNNINVILARGGEYPKIYSDPNDIIIPIGKIDPNKVEKLNFDDQKLNIIEEYLSNRFIGQAKNIDFDILNTYQNKQKFDKNDLVQYYGSNFKKENDIIFIFLHGFSDANHASGQMSFTSYYDWFTCTIDFIKNLENINWIIKPHPSVKVYGEEGIVENILKQTKATNIYLAPKNISNLSVFDICNVVVTATGTIGIEASCMGIRAILVGNAAYSSFGFTIDCKNKKEYFENLSNIDNIKPLSDKEILLAKKVMYMYHLGQDLHSNILVDDGNLTPDENLTNDEKMGVIYNQVADNLLKYDYKNDSFYKYVESDILPKL